MDFFTGLWSLQGMVLLVLQLIAFAVCVYALVDAIRQRSAAFSAAGKQTKRLWLILLGVATAISFVSISGGLDLLFFDAIAVVVAAVYLTDVRPAVRGMTGGGSAGPYGRW
jgi:predicted Co/Zn/Cd cation transporter (cation efflux family)